MPVKELIIYTISMAAAVILSEAGSFTASGLSLILCGIIDYVCFYKRERDILTPCGLFSLFFVLPMGIASLKLSYLSNVFEPLTWLCLYFSFVFFVCGYYALKKKKICCRNIMPGSIFYEYNEKQLRRIILMFTLVSVFAFTFEAVRLSYIPLFTVDTPHAYSYFHISGVHYFTVLFVFVPALTVYWMYRERGRGMDRAFFEVMVCTVISLVLPLLLVSRYQLIFSVMLAAMMFIILNRERPGEFLKAKFIITGCISVLSLIALYVFLTVERAHSVSYLNGIFEMKNENMPIFITQPYMYIANNYENFNCLVRDLPKHTYGLRQLFPVFALTGLKFRFPELVSFPLYVTKEELTTVTVIYDAFYDFGAAGVSAFCFIYGAAVSLLERLLKTDKNPMVCLLCAQVYGYLCLSFFTTWYSNPTTWFYIIITVAVWIFLCYTSKNRTFRKGETK